jgi:hypothetical protein
VASVNASGTGLTVNLNISFTQIAAGGYNVMTVVYDAEGDESPPQQVGSLTIGVLPETSPPVTQDAPSDAPAPQTVPVLSASTQNCNDISGQWVETPSQNSTITWSLSQTGSTIGANAAGTLTVVTSLGTVTWSVSGGAANGTAQLTASNPNPPVLGGVEFASQVTVILTLTGCQAGSAQDTDTYPTYISSFGPVTPPPTVRNTSWTRISAPPGMVMLVDLSNDKVGLILTGLNKTGPLNVVINGTSAANTATMTTLASVPNASYSLVPTYSLQRTSLSPGQYSSVVATWDDISVTVPVGFYVIGNTRFSQYNPPYETQCSANPQAAQIIYKIDSQYCYYQRVQMGSMFMSQVSINGTGVYGTNTILKAYNAGARGVCSLYAGFTSGNTFFSVDAGGSPIAKISGTHNTVLSDGTGTTSPVNNNNPPPGSVAVLPAGSVPSSPFIFGDQILLIGQNDTNDPLGPRSVEDLCPACGPGTFAAPAVAHIDMYSSSHACSGTDYGPNVAIRLR